MKPIIGITTSLNEERAMSLGNAYARAVEGSGGIPVALPFTESADALREYAELCSGFVFSGGFDVEPSLYGEKTKEKCGTVQSYRDCFEISLFGEVYKIKKPIIGICRGSQLINVALGGTLFQDITSEIKTDIAHSQSAPKWEHSHVVTILEGTPLHGLVKSAEIGVNSFHHQSVKAMGKGLLPMAYAPDGVVEAYYLDAEQYLRGYQWHPELMFGRYDTSKIIFEDFINACKKGNKRNR